MLRAIIRLRWVIAIALIAGAIIGQLRMSPAGVVDGVVSIIIAWLIGGAFAAAVLFPLRIADRYTQQLAVLLCAAAFTILGMLTALAFVDKALGPDVDPVGDVTGFQLGISFGTTSFLFWQRAAARRLAWKHATAAARPPAVPASAPGIEPHDFMWQRGALGVAAATAVCYVAALVPVFLELAATEPSDREWLGIMVLILFAVALPVGAIIGLAFVPAFLLGRRQAWYGRMFYILWGWLAVITAALWTTGAGFGNAGAETRTWILAGAVILGPLVGWAFWAGAYGPLARRVLQKS